MALELNLPATFIEAPVFRGFVDVLREEFRSADSRMLRMCGGERVG